MRNWEFVCDGLKCSMKFLDADVKRPLASASVDERNIVVFGPQESYIQSTELTNEQGDRRVCGAVGRTSGFENDAHVRFEEPSTDERTPVFRRPG